MVRIQILSGVGGLINPAISANLLGILYYPHLLSHLFDIKIKTPMLMVQHWGLQKTKFSFEEGMISELKTAT